MKKSLTYKFIFVFSLFNFWVSLCYAQSSLAGFILDDKSGEKIPHALIKVGSIETILSDSIGFFSIDLMPNSYDIEVLALGYQSQKLRLKIEEKKTDLFVRLIPAPVLISGVTVTGERFLKEINTNTYELQPGDLSKIPQVGEPDVLRSIQALPGVTSISDLSTQIFLRGGNFDETLISLDNVPIFNPYHLGEMFSSINPDIIQLERLYTSNYPSNYSGFLSGILDLKSKSNYESNYSISLGLLSSKLYANVPIHIGSLTIAARRTYFDLLTKISGTDFPYYFYDLYGKYEIPLDKNNLIEISALYTKDVYDIFSGSDYEKIGEGTNPAWGNILFNAKYSYFLNEDDFINVNLYSSNSILNADATAKYLPTSMDIYPNESGADSVNSIFIDNYIKEYGLVSSFNFHLEGHSFITGFGLKLIKLKYLWDIRENDLSGLLKYPLEEVFFDFADNPYSLSDNVSEYSGFIVDKIQITKEIELTPGIRTTYLSSINNVFLMPFILFLYNINESIRLKASFGSYYQYLYTIKEQQHEQLYAPFSSYFITKEKDRVGFSNHYTIGFEIKNIFPNAILNIEPYYKTRENLSSSYKTDKKISFENGYATGIEFLLKKPVGFLNGWVSYSLSRTVKENSDYSYFANYDRTHNLKILINFQPLDNWTISGFWIYSSGLPATPAVGKFLRGNDYSNNNTGFPSSIYYEGRVWDIIEGKKNSIRLSDFSRLDLGITGNFLLGKMIIKPYLQVLNVYNSVNPYFYSASGYDTSLKDGEERGSFIIPTIGVSIDF